MNITQLKRIIISGWRSFWRNGWLSGATVGIMTLTLFTITSLILVSVILSTLLVSLQDKVDISVYFTLNATETEILNIKEDLAKLEEIKNVEYVSRDDALGLFEERHKENEVLQESLDEIGSNPFQASLNIRAIDPNYYANISSFLESRYDSLIDKVNFQENQLVIERLAEIIGVTRRSGVIISLSLGLIAILVAFNTIRLAIYSNRQEIEIMKLVGASNWFVRGPFVVEGILYGVFAALVALFIIYPVILIVGPKISSFVPVINLTSYFNANLLSLLFVNLGLGIVLGTVSSAIAVRRYLRV